MKKILLVLLILFNVHNAHGVSNLTEVTEGQVIHHGFYNKILSAINIVLDGIRIPSGENVFSARISSTGIVSQENTDWIQGNANVQDTNHFILSLKSGEFFDSPMCIATVFQGLDANQVSVGIETLSHSIVSFRTGVQTNVFYKNPREFMILCKRTSDNKGYKTLRTYLIEAGLTFLN